DEAERGNLAGGGVVRIQVGERKVAVQRIAVRHELQRTAVSADRLADPPLEQQLGAAQVMRLEALRIERDRAVEAADGVDMPPRVPEYQRHPDISVRARRIRGQRALEARQGLARAFQLQQGAAEAAQAAEVRGRKGEQ